jgi:hypothetical protein
MMSGNDIGISYGEVGLELATLLNELYGIESDDVFGAELCSLPADPGPCNAAFIRYRYDPQAARCVEFGWGGCGGNANTFDSLDACNQLCGNRRASVCMPVGDCSACPAELDSSGLSCSNAGLTCGWGGCGGGICDCVADGEGGLVWECVVNLC